MLTPVSSFPQKRESSQLKGFWIPALRSARSLPLGVTTVTWLRGYRVAGLLIAAISRLGRCTGRCWYSTAGNPADGTANSCPGRSSADRFAGRRTRRLAGSAVAGRGWGAVSLLRDAVSLLGDAVPLLGDPVPLLGDPVSLLGGPVSLLRGPISLLRRIPGGPRLARCTVTRLLPVGGRLTVPGLLVLSERQA